MQNNVFLRLAQERYTTKHYTRLKWRRPHSYDGLL